MKNSMFIKFYNKYLNGSSDIATAAKFVWDSQQRRINKLERVLEFYANLNATSDYINYEGNTPTEKIENQWYEIGTLARRVLGIKTEYDR